MIEMDYDGNFRYPKRKRGGGGMKKFVGWALVASVVLGVIATVFSYDPAFSDAVYTLAGLGFYVFGTWGAVLLLK
jgi:hypothetical protein